MYFKYLIHGTGIEIYKRIDIMPITMKYLKPHKRYATLLVALALMFNALSPLLFTLNSYASAATNTQSSLGNKILICTANGFEYISLEDYENGNYPQDKSSIPHCPLCIISSASADKFCPTAITVTFPKITTTSIYYSDVAQISSLHITADNIRSRAPPYFI